MKRLEELNELITKKEKELKPLEKERRELWREQQAAVQVRIEKAEMGKGDFKLDELTFAAFKKCRCGAGLAYPNNTGMHGSWQCSDILRGKALPASNPESKEHDGGFPFQFYSIKGEGQPSARGVTTRPE